MSYNSREEKRKWAESLKTGDLVEDCRYRNLKIKKIQLEYTWPRWIVGLSVILPDWIPSFIWWRWFDFIQVLAPYLASRSRFLDAQLILEDGSHCSAMECCDDPSLED